jgi:VWFA-related protein
MRLRTACLLAGLASVVVGAQQPTFRGGANYVRVDMYALVNGQPVDDLKPEEVELREDGVVQNVETFEHVAVRAAGPQDTRIEPNTVAESRQAAADPRARVFVIFLDTYHTQLGSSANMRAPLGRFLDRLLGPDDLVAVMTPEMSAADLAFGRKTTIVSNIFQEEWWGRRLRGVADEDEKERLYRSCYPEGDRIADELRDRRRERLTLDALADLVVYLRGVREERKAIVTITEGWRLYTENRRLLANSGREAPPLGPPITVGGGRVGIGDRTSEGRPPIIAGVDRTMCDTDRINLAMMNSQQRLRDIEEDANRANVTFYPVGAQGLAVFDSPIGPDKPPPPSVDAANLRARQDSLRELAENTDGIAVVSTNNIEAGMRRIVADLTSYYLLGYYSTNTKLDGRFRAISVRVKRPGVQVRARRGYRGLTAEELVSGGAAPGGAAGAGGAGRAGTPGAAGSASRAPLSVAVNPRAPFRIRTSGWTVADGGEAAAAAWIVGELDYATRKELAWSAGAKAEVTVVAASGADVSSTTVDVAATDGSFAVRVPQEGRIAPGEYAIRVRVRPNGDPGLPVTDTARLIIAEKPSPLGEPVLWRRGPSTGPRYAMTADPRFQRSERVRFEMATTETGTATGRMLDRNGNPMQIPVQITERADPSGSFRWIVADAVLAPLAPGDYAIEVTLGSAKQTGSFRVVP